MDFTIDTSIKKDRKYNTVQAIQGIDDLDTLNQVERSLLEESSTTWMTTGTSEALREAMVNRRKELQDRNNKNVQVETNKILEKECESLKSLNTYIQNRKNQTWAQNYDEYSNLAENLNVKLRGRIQNMFKMKRDKDNMWNEWNEINSEAEEIQKEVAKRDAAQIETINNVKSVFPELEVELDKIIKASRLTNSSLYKDVVKAARAYRQAKTFDERVKMIGRLKNAINVYTKTRYKKSYWLSFIAEKRMRRMDKVLALISVVEGVRDYRQRRVKGTGEIDKRKAEYELKIKGDTYKKVGLSDSSRVYQVLEEEERDSEGNITEAGEKTVENNKRTVDLINDADKSYENERKVLIKLYKDLQLKEEYSEKDITISEILKLMKNPSFMRKFDITNNFNDIWRHFRDKYREKVQDDSLMQYINKRVTPVQRIIPLISTFLKNQGVSISGGLEDYANNIQSLKRIYNAAEVSGQSELFEDSISDAKLDYSMELKINKIKL